LERLSGEVQLAACKAGGVLECLEQKMKMKMKRTSKKRKREPEITSGSKRLSHSAPPIVAREKLAKKVEKLAVEAFRMYEQGWKRLSELRPLIAQLRELFMKLTPGEKIAGCATWTEYCKRVLHRTDRRVRQILVGANPASEKHSRKSPQAEEENTPSEPTRFMSVNVETVPCEPRIVHVNVQKAPLELPRFVQVKVKNAPVEPKTMKVPDVRDAEWTPELVVETSFNFVYSVFEKAKLSDEDHNKAGEQLLDKLRQEILFRP
jgi:hypothetical protein